MDTITTYDIKQHHTEIKTELKSLGHKDTVAGEIRGTNTPVVHQLPNTTLLKYGQPVQLGYRSGNECN